MTTLAERTIAALRANHDRLATLAAGFTEDDLARSSGASEWTVAQVLSHLGSGAEIGYASYSASLAGEEPGGQEFNQEVWSRWDATPPREQAIASIEHGDRLVRFLEGLSDEQREHGEITLGYMPAPVPLVAIAGLRLNEAALHGWDVRVAFDPDATLTDEEGTLLLEQLSGPIAFMLGFTGKADRIAGGATVGLAGSDLALEIGERAAMVPAHEVTTATLFGPAEAVVRLLAGRLDEQHTPPKVSVDGAVTLGDLRNVFPGY
jgi:uncharacterized protein (TIGR03083 family)